MRSDKTKRSADAVDSCVIVITVFALHVPPLLLFLIVGVLISEIAVVAVFT
jgi:hypothetical protein